LNKSGHNIIITYP